MRRLRIRNSKNSDNGLYVPVEDLPAIRERAFRRGLEHAGYLPRSVELAVEDERDWIEKEVGSCPKCEGRREAWGS